jgi:hypothetical protein
MEDAVKDNDLMTEKQFADFLSVSPRTLANWRADENKNSPPYFMLGGSIRYSLQKYQEWKEASQTLGINT